MRGCDKEISFIDTGVCIQGKVEVILVYMALFLCIFAAAVGRIVVDVVEAVPVEMLVVADFLWLRLQYCQRGCIWCTVGELQN